MNPLVQKEIDYLKSFFSKRFDVDKESIQVEVNKEKRTIALFSPHSKKLGHFRLVVQMGES